MFDLDQLQQMNEAAHQRAVARSLEKRRPVPALRPAYPLFELASLITIGPPSISYLMDLLENSEVIADFRSLVREFLPEHEPFIMEQDNEGRLREFIYYFQRQYFPLSDNILLGEMTLADFIREIPVDLMGYTFEDHHSFSDFRDGHILMLSLTTTIWDDAGNRIPILEKVTELVGKDLADLIPPEGWSAEDLHRMLDDTDYAGVADFADWVSASTGCMLLDAAPDSYEGERWSRELVDALTEQHPRMVEIWDRMYNTMALLEEDIHHRFRDLLSTLLDRKDMVVPREQMAFPLDEEGQVMQGGYYDANYQSLPSLQVGDT